MLIERQLARFIYEMFHLKQIRHEGELFTGISNAVTVADHSLNAAQIGYILAAMANKDKNKIATMLVWHDMAETRSWDLHLLAKRYMKNKDEAEQKIIKDQLLGLPIEEKLWKLVKEFYDGKTEEALLAKDADILEQIFQMKIYKKTWIVLAKKYIKYLWKTIKTKEGKTLYKQLKYRHFYSWFLDVVYKKHKSNKFAEVDLIFEGFYLRKIKHEWRRTALIQNPDSVAEHSLLAAQIWYIISIMEWADENKVATMLVWHDIAETRIWDQHKVASRYLDQKKEAEELVMKNQLSWFEFWKDIRNIFDEYEIKSTLEWQIAKDSDYLEQAFQGKIYKEIWYKNAQVRIDNVWKAIKIPFTQKLRNQIELVSPVDWRKETDLPKLSNDHIS